MEGKRKGKGSRPPVHIVDNAVVSDPIFSILKPLSLDPPFNRLVANARMAPSRGTWGHQLHS